MSRVAVRSLCCSPDHRTGERDARDLHLRRRGDAVDNVARLKEASEVPLRSHGSLSVNRALMAAGLVDRVQLTIFPVITGQTGVEPIFQGAADFDLELIESRTLGGHTQELVYRPTLHV
jgi:dihydrofolate reductase